MNEETINFELTVDEIDIAFVDFESEVCPQSINDYCSIHFLIVGMFDGIDGLVSEHVA